MLLILLTIAVIAAIIYYVKSVTYWKRHGVPQVSLLFMITDFINFLLQKTSFSENIDLYYKMFPKGRYIGYYNFLQPVLFVKDTELLKEITVKNFDHFPDHVFLVLDEVEPLWSRNLFALKGQKWRDMRPILSPTFTSSKMRTVFGLISECAKNDSQFYIKKEEPIIEVEFKDSFTRFTNDVIATAAFGIKIDSLQNQNDEFYLMAKKVTNFTTNPLMVLKFFLMTMCPKFCKIVKLRLFKEEVTGYFIKLIEDTLRIRKEQNILRPDMIHLLLEAQKKLIENKDPSFANQEETEPVSGKGLQKELTNLDIAAQALIFFFAGLESVASSLCFMAHELALNPDIQIRLRNEIVQTLENCEGNLTYEALLEMKYMDMVVSEVLRKWPPVAATDRECTKPYTIQPKLPGEKPVHIKLKHSIWLPIYGLHHDPNIYPEPDRFDPERFNDENKPKINAYTYLPFGLGPRNCIGSRFALLEIKTLFFYLLSNFELVPIEKTRIPIKLAPNSINLTAVGGFWYGLKKLDQ